jgi:hypothetical protein
LISGVVSEKGTALNSSFEPILIEMQNVNYFFALQVRHDRPRSDPLRGPVLGV